MSPSTKQPASIVIPTRSRTDYLEVALASIAPQAAAEGGEVLVVDDDLPSERVRGLAARFGARYVPNGAPRGLNAARNTGVQRSTGELVVFVDDDVEVRAGWLAALLSAARALPEVDVFTGPIRPRLEGHSLRSCGREGPPVSSLDLGPRDADARYAWGANMAIRRTALERVGPFDVAIEHGGDESEWQDRHRAGGGSPPRYVARAALDHRRAGPDARLRALTRTAWVRGRAARRYNTIQEIAPPLGRELSTVSRTLAHVVMHACPAGLTAAAHNAGRLYESLVQRRAGADRASAPAHGGAPAPAGASRGFSALAGSPAGIPAPAGSPAGIPAPAGSPAGIPAPEDFLSGASGTVGGADGVRRALLDAGVDTLDVLAGRRARLAVAARRRPSRQSVLVLGIERPQRRRLVDAMCQELRRSRHAVELHLAPPGGSGKFENLNALLAAHPADGHDWLLVIDDDVVLPRGFLDRFLFLAQRFDLSLAQPAHRLNSHAAWEVTRRRRGSAVRETSFVEIGPVTAFARRTFSELLPFPALRMGWGLDVHWAALARGQGWRCGVVDAVAINHRAAPAADAYSRETAIAEARAFLAERPYLTAADAQRTLTTHRRW